MHIYYFRQLCMTVVDCVNCYICIRIYKYSNLIGQLEIHYFAYRPPERSYVIVIFSNQLPRFVCNIEAQIPRQSPRDECFYIAYKARDWLITSF